MRGRAGRGGVLAVAYGIACYLLGLAAILYMIAFLASAAVPKTVDSGEAGPLGVAVAIDLALVLLFAVQHSVMARRAFKHRWTCIVPDPLERSTFVLATAVVLFAVYAAWRPIPTVVWDVGGGPLAWAVWGLYAVGWATLFAATFHIDHADLFGLKQVFRHARGEAPRPVPFRTPGLYRLVRHPLYLGLVIALFATPRMTAGHLLLALAFLAYILVAVHLEERDLVAAFGDDYEAYRRRTGMLLPRLFGRG